MTFREAIRKALSDEMSADKNVVLFGEDVGVYGGCFKVDEVEEIARERAKALFGAEHANVQFQSDCRRLLLWFVPMGRIPQRQPLYILYR